MRGIVKGGLNDGGSNIKSIQRGTITLSGTSTNVTISPIDISKSIVLISIEGANIDNAFRVLVSGRLTSSTNLLLTVGNIDYPPTVSWQVIEFNNVKSLQRGYTSINSDIQTVTISSVNTSKSFLVTSKDATLFDTANFGLWFSSAALTNSTTITFSQLFSNKPGNVAWEVIEFN